MDLLDRAIAHISEVARVPSFSSYEERLHPYIHQIFSDISDAALLEMPGNNLAYYVSGKGNKTIASTAHLDKITITAPIILRDCRCKLPQNILKVPWTVQWELALF